MPNSQEELSAILLAEIQKSTLNHIAQMIQTLLDARTNGLSIFNLLTNEEDELDIVDSKMLLRINILDMTNMVEAQTTLVYSERLAIHFINSELAENDITGLTPKLQKDLVLKVQMMIAERTHIRNLSTTNGALVAITSTINHLVDRQEDIAETTNPTSATTQEKKTSKTEKMILDSLRTEIPRYLDVLHSNLEIVAYKFFDLLQLISKYDENSSKNLEKLMTNLRKGILFIVNKNSGVGISADIGSHNELMALLKELNTVVDGIDDLDANPFEDINWAHFTHLIQTDGGEATTLSSDRSAIGLLSEYIAGKGTTLNLKLKHLQSWADGIKDVLSDLDLLRRDLLTTEFVEKFLLLFFRNCNSNSEGYSILALQTLMQQLSDELGVTIGINQSKLDKNEDRSVTALYTLKTMEAILSSFLTTPATTANSIK